MKKMMFFVIVLSFFSCGQAIKGQENYTTLETKVEKCYDDWFAKNDVDWNELQKSFENYFSSSGISRKNEPLEEQYEKILSYISRPIHGFPKMKDKKKKVMVTIWGL